MKDKTLRGLILTLFAATLSFAAVTTTAFPQELVPAPPFPAGSGTPELKKAGDLREKATVAAAKEDAATAQEEVVIQERALNVERKNAEVELQEAELAKEEAEAIKKSEVGREKIEEAIARVEKEEREALIAHEKARLAEKRMLAAQERARLTEEKLFLAQKRATQAEALVKDKKTVFYWKLLRTALVLVIGYLLIFILVRIINSRVTDLKIQHLFRKNVIYFLNLLIILFIIFIWIQQIGTLTIFLSAVGAGVALALQELILSFAGWFVILFQRPFEVGDRIEYGGVKGDVIDIRILQTSLLEIGNWVDADQSTGRLVNVPNSAVFKKETYNYSRGFEYIWNEIKVLVTFESDWKRAEAIMLAPALKRAEGMEDVIKRKIKKMSRRYMIHFSKLTSIVYVNIKESGVELTLRYLTEARKRRSTEDEYSREILEAFEKEEKVDFAYPTYRIVK